jgi:hypothetical protein
LIDDDLKPFMILSHDIENIACPFDDQRAK